MGSNGAAMAHPVGEALKLDFGAGGGEKGRGCRFVTQLFADALILAVSR